MATAISTKIISVDLSLTESEARYLMGLLQNYIGEGEPQIDKENREAIFNCLHGIFYATQAEGD